MSKKQIITNLTVIDTPVRVMRVGQTDYISLTDMARYYNPDDPSGVIKNWMRAGHTIDYLGCWEQLRNPQFNSVEFDLIKSQSRHNAFTMSPKQWLARTNAIGLVSKGGKYSLGTFAHSHIALKFAAWISVDFELHLIQEFERLKQDEAYRHKLVWSAHREIAKSNYLIHTQAIKEVIVPQLTAAQKRYVYANEADMLNVVLFGQRAAQWRKDHPQLQGNIRDYATDAQLKVLINLENTNAQLIKAGQDQATRMTTLHHLAVEQLTLFAQQEQPQLSSS